MCLCKIHTEEQRKRTINKLKFSKEGYKTVYKVFGVDDDGNLIAQFVDYKFRKGKNTARNKYIIGLDGDKEFHQYTPGFHAFLTKGKATKWISNCNWTRAKSGKLIVKSVKIKKEWITDIGRQSHSNVVVSKHIII